MKLIVTILIATAVLAGTALAAEKSVKMKDLPPAVQKAVGEQTKGSTLKGLSEEVENGQTFYEAETVRNGHGRDLLFDATGAVVEIEEEVSLDSIPAPAKSAIERRAAGGKITKVETLTKGQAVSYEAAITKGGKKSEVGVNADGSPVK